MKRRISKKHHVKDFVEYGTLVQLVVPHNNTNEILAKFQNVVEKHNLSAWGGGCQFILTPNVSYNYIIPTVIEQFIIGMMSVEDINTMAFIVHKPNKNADLSTFVTDIETTFNEVMYQLKVFPRIDLWQKSKK